MVDLSLEVMVVPLLFLVVPAALILTALVGVPRLYERSRQKAFAAFCLERGYQYVPRRLDATAQYADVVGMFKSSANRTWRDEICGQLNSRPFTTFEYQYVDGAGRSRMVFNRAMIHWNLDGTPLPRFTLVPASTYLFRTGHAPNDIDFPDDIAFSKAYILNGEDQAAISGLFTPVVRAALVAMPGQFMAGRGADLFWWLERSLPRPDRIDSFLADGDHVRELLAHG